MTPKEMIEVLQAFEAGKTIQIRTSPNQWKDALTPIWNFRDCDYRIKPEPMTIWVNVYYNGSTGLVYKTKEEAIAAGCVSGKTIKFIQADE